jgi:hypothetical protein
MNFRTTTFPEVSVGTDAYDDEEESKEDNHYRMAQEWFMGAATSSRYMTWAVGLLPISKCQREGVSYGCIGCSQTDRWPAVPDRLEPRYHR